MKSTSRRFSQCMFCGGHTITREHVFGKAISRKFPPHPVQIRRSRFQGLPEDFSPEDRRKYIRQGGDHALALTSLCMCQTCNNELGRELSPLSAAISRLFKAETNIISSDMSYKFLRYFQRIGIIVDLETSAVGTLPATESSEDSLFNRNYHTSPPIISAEERKRFREGELLQKVGVHIGRHLGNHGKKYGMNVAFVRPADLTETFYKGFTFSIDRFTCLIEIGTYSMNRNDKLQKINLDGNDIRIDPVRVSSDEDVMLNYAPLDVYPNDETVPTIFLGRHQQA